MIIKFIAGVIGAFIAIYSFAVYIEVPKNYLLRAGLVGGIGGFTYLLSMEFQLGDVGASFLSALVAAIVAHIFARLFKAPVTLFLIPGILPTVPGAGMYRTVYYVITGNETLAGYYLIQTLEIAGGIALAIFVVDSLFRALQKGDWKQNSLTYIKGKSDTPKQ
ncbi:threonine/serine exporter family protein [Roseburia hominis]